MKNFSLLLIVGSILFAGFKSPASQPLSIAAASDMKFAMDSIVAVFKKSNPDVAIQVTYGSSGKFFEQISNDAPYDIYFSADIAYPQKLREKGFAITEPKIYGIGQIVIWSKKNDPNTDKMNALADISIKKIAIANPAHAPYGKRAVESMKFYKIYDQVKSKLVLGENITQTAQFVTLGAADIGIIALSLALSPPMQKEGGKYFIIPEESHQPLKQGYVILKRAKSNSTAIKFADFCESKTAKNILTHFGFS